jgi:hypothetical protein
MSQFDEEGNGPSIENGPNENGDKVERAEKREERKRRGKGKKEKGNVGKRTVSQYGAEGVMINCGVALNGDSEFLQGS